MAPDGVIVLCKTERGVMDDGALTESEEEPEDASSERRDGGAGGAGRRGAAQGGAGRRRAALWHTTQGILRDAERRAMSERSA